MQIKVRIIEKGMCVRVCKLHRIIIFRRLIRSVLRVIKYNNKYRVDDDRK